MTYQNIDNRLQFLYGLNRKGIKLGLEHIKSIMGLLGNPQENYKLIHIAGTNGKGSTVAHLCRLFMEYGFKVGVYTSPHLIKFNERIKVNNRSISDFEIISFMDKVNSEITSLDLTFFEVTTAMAFNYFNEENVDIAVIETGLGGRLDSTNIINPILTVMTPISIDHIDILGNTIEKIAYEKAGIIKKNIPLITSEQAELAMKVLQKKSFEKKAEIIISEKPKSINIDIYGTSFFLGGEKYITPLFGKYQAENASLAISAIKHLVPEISYSTVKVGLASVKWAGRLQCVSEKIYYDVSHNESGINVTLNTLKELFPGSKIHGLFCVKGDKELHRIAKQIKFKFETLLVSSSNNGFLLKPKQLSDQLKKLGIENTPFEKLNKGINQLLKIKKSNDVGLIFGSHYIAGEVFSAFEISFDSE